MLIVVLLSGGLAALLGFNTALAQGSFTASKLQKQATELDDRSQSLSEQLARAAAPDRLAQAARRIGMVPAPGVAFIQLQDGTITGGAQPAPYIPPPLTPAQQAEQSAKAKAEAQQAAQQAARAQEAKAARKALKQQQLAAQQAAAAAQAARDQAQRDWQQKLAEQEKAGSRGGGEQVVDPPPGN
jgi:multidrug efflux pump subunit AcrA (membrane-fusion protein)